MNKMTKAQITTGQTLQHCNFGEVRVLQVMARGILVAQTTGREGNKQTVEHVVASRDLEI